MVFCNKFITWWHGKTDSQKVVCRNVEDEMWILEKKQRQIKTWGGGFMVSALQSILPVCQRAKARLYVKPKGGASPCLSFGSFLCPFPMYVCIYTTLPLWGGFPKGGSVVCMEVCFNFFFGSFFFVAGLRLGVWWQAVEV